MGFIRIILTMSLLISILTSYNLWCGERTFPQIPVWPQFYLNRSGEWFLLILYCLSLLASLFLRRERLSLFISLIIAFVFVLTDLNRLQPWFYFYNAMLLIFVFYNGRVDDPNKFTSYFIILQLIFASVYFFCGLNRFGLNFVEQEFTTSIAPLNSILSIRHFLFLIKIGQFIPFILVFIGLSLIITPLRYLAFSFVIVFHLILFILFSPIMRIYNYPLWLSQIAFAFLSFFLFSGKTKQRYFSPSFLFKVPLFYLTMLLFVIFPFCNQMDVWPNCFSFSFKNLKHSNKHLIINSAEYNSLPMYPRSFCRNLNENYVLDYQAWCENELNVSCNEVMRVESSIKNYIEITARTKPPISQLATKYP
jgi:hypothetical protein